MLPHEAPKGDRDPARLPPLPVPPDRPRTNPDEPRIGGGSRSELARQFFPFRCESIVGTVGTC